MSATLTARTPSPRIPIARRLVQKLHTVSLTRTASKLSCSVGAARSAIARTLARFSASCPRNGMRSSAPSSAVTFRGCPPGRDGVASLTESVHERRGGYPLLLRSGVPVRLDHQPVGAAGAGPAGLHGADWPVFISLRMINLGRWTYDAHFPAGYEARAYRRLLRLLRVAAQTRVEHGLPGPRRRRRTLYAALGGRIDLTAPNEPGHLTDAAYARGTRAFVEPVLAERGAAGSSWPNDALEDEALDDVLRRESDEALALTGKDVGTPIIQFRAAARGRVLRPGDQPGADVGRGGAAVGQRGRPGQLPGLRRAQAQPARAAAAAQLRGGLRATTTPRSR